MRTETAVLADIARTKEIIRTRTAQRNHAYGTYEDMKASIERHKADLDELQKELDELHETQQDESDEQTD